MVSPFMRRRSSCHAAKSPLRHWRRCSKAISLSAPPRCWSGRTSTSSSLPVPRAVSSTVSGGTAKLPPASRASGRDATTTTTAVLRALQAIGATSLAVATPYLDEINAIERQFLEASGFRIASIAGLGCGTDAEIGRLEPADAVSLVELVDTPEADAVFISCTNFHCLSAIASLERRLGKPVVTSNLAGAWAALRQIGVEDPIPGYGQLLLLPAVAEAMAP
jgi:maleate cis-trans isomerase